LRRLFARFDADRLDAVLGAWAVTRTALVAGRRVIAIDGNRTGETQHDITGDTTKNVTRTDHYPDAGSTRPTQCRASTPSAPL
jgi:hypothetical protein